MWVLRVEANASKYCVPEALLLGQAHGPRLRPSSTQRWYSIRSESAATSSREAVPPLYQFPEYTLKASGTYR